MHVKGDRHRAPLDRDRYDVVVVGSGVGGLTAAALLARRGLSVLVIEKHAAPGGNATVFHHSGYTFDVGLHYTSGCAPDGDLTRILRAAGAESLAFQELDPDGFDTLVFPDLVFRVPRGVEAYRDRLVAAFPREARGIDRYLGVLAALWELRRLPALRPARIPGALLRARKGLAWVRGTLRDLLDACTRDPRLRAVLAGQGVDYAEPPSRVALPVHAAIVMGFLEGAYYPRGGGQTVADALAASVERHGGRVLLLARATRIVVEGGRARGVELESHHLGRLTVGARAVISNADLKHTLLGLLGRGDLRPETRARVRRYEMAPALGVVYLGVRRDLRAEGHRATNYIVHPEWDVEPAYAAARAGAFHGAPFCYVSSATLKDPDGPRFAPAGAASVELMTVVPSRPEAWGTTAAAVRAGHYRRDPGYVAAKKALARRLVSVAERALPGLAAHIVHEEVATPATHTRYTGSTGGTGYGLALVPRQFLHRRPGHATEVRGLYLCGASTLTAHGVVGTAWSGVLAAARVGGWKLLQDVVRPRRA